MSYEILYRALFITDGKQILPLIECGSNNCYDSDPRKKHGCGRRSRNWEIVKFSTVPEFDKEKLLEDVLAFGFSHDEYKEYVMYRGKWQSKAQHAAWLMRQINNAITQEEANERFPYLNIMLKVQHFTGTWDNVRTTERHAFVNGVLSAALADMHSSMAALSIDKHCAGVHLYGLPDNIGKKRPYVFKPPLKDYFVIRVNPPGFNAQTYYFLKLTPRGMRGAWEATRSKRFKTMRMAERYVSQLHGRFPTHGTEIVEMHDKEDR